MRTIDDGLPLYLPDHLFVTLACDHRLQLCNSADGACTALTGNNLTTYDAIGLNDKQLATAERILLARLHSHIYDTINGACGSALAANDHLVDLFSPQLPDDQWIREVTRMYQTALANVQLRIVDFPNNAWLTNDSETLGVIAAQNWAESEHNAMAELCKQQRVQSTNQYQSFSFWGVIIVVAVSSILIITSWTLESCVERRPDLRARDGVKLEGEKRYRQRAWIADGKLQLLRMALKDAGYVNWVNEMEYVPYREVIDDIDPVIEEDGAVMYRTRAAPAFVPEVQDVQPVPPLPR